MNNIEKNNIVESIMEKQAMGLVGGVARGLNMAARKLPGRIMRNPKKSLAAGATAAGGGLLAALPPGSLVESPDLGRRQQGTSLEGQLRRWREDLQPDYDPDTMGLFESVGGEGTYQHSPTTFGRGNDSPIRNPYTDPTDETGSYKNWDRSRLIERSDGYSPSN